MKIRQDFVTNSSSSSFIISKKYLDQDQLDAINDHVEIAEMIGVPVNHKWDYPWTIEENEHFITGRADMDNFPMGMFLSKIGIPDSVIRWNEFGFDLDEEKPEDDTESEVPNESGSYYWRDAVARLRNGTALAGGFAYEDSKWFCN